jgi:hypothetical protein
MRVCLQDLPLRNRLFDFRHIQIFREPLLLSMHAELVCSLPDQLPDFVNAHDLYRQSESHRPSQV